MEIIAAVLIGVTIGWVSGVPIGFFISKFFSFTGRLKIREDEVERRVRNRMATMDTMRRTNLRKNAK